VHIRVDAAGTPIVDDQTIQDNPNASETRKTIQSKRTYLCDASFVAVVVPGPHVTREAIAAAAVAPVFSPCLGRRACVLSSPLLLAAEVTGADPVALFEGIERGPLDLIEQLAGAWHPLRSGSASDRSGRDAATNEYSDYYLDVPDYPGALRRIPVRDDLTGPLPRQWRERVAVHVRTRPASPAT
jgi:hypothetical protein